MALPQAPKRQDTKTFPTPIVGDVLFSQIEDRSRATFPAYGTPHPDSAKWPNHKLVFIRPVENARDNIYEFFYCADRDNQDTYNWEYTAADIGGNRYDAVARTYVIPRDSFDPESPAMGSTMPNVPVDLFPNTYVLASREQKRIGEKELDSLYVVEQRTYVKRCTLIDVVGSKVSIEERLYYKGEQIDGTPVENLFSNPSSSFWEVQSDGSSRIGKQLSCDWYSISTQKELQIYFIWPTPEKTDFIFYVVRSSTSSPATIANYGASFGSPYPDHKLVYVSPTDERGRSKFYYAADRASQDKYNWEFSKANIGGQSFDSVKRTYVTLRSNFSPTTPAMGTAMPNVPSGLFTGSYVLAERSQARIGDQTLDALFVVDIHNYVKRCTIRNIETDAINGKLLTSTETLYYATEVVEGLTVTAANLFANTTSAPANSYWGVQSDGYENSGKQLSCEWYSITKRQLINGTFNGVVATLVTYQTTQRYYWPPVLETFELMDWERKDGGTDIYPRYTFNPDGYNGPCKATVVRTWSKNPQILSEIIQLLPTPITYASPYFTLTIPECLHPLVTVVCNTGSSDPVYEVTSGSSREISATNYTTWPEFFVASDEQDAYKGGYLRTTVTIFRPTLPEPEPPM